MNVEDILKEQNITYIIKGHDYIIQCLNPNHEDTNPSMRVDKTTGLFNCFSCSARGNLFTRFNKIVNSLNIRQQSILERIDILFQPNIALPFDAQPFNHDFRDISEKTLKHFEAFTSNTPDWEGRIVFPIKDFKNKIQGFIGRYTHSKLDPKYIVLPHGRPLPIFPPANMLEPGTVVLVEGIFDLLNLYDKGITNVITGFGLIRPKKRNKNIIDIHERFATYKIMGITRIVIIYDGDKPGHDAAILLRDALSEYIAADIIELPDGKDPGSLNDNSVYSLKRKIYEDE